MFFGCVTMRASGILLPVSCLPSKYGIGTLGRDAYRFVDFLKKASQRYWQILPLGPTSYGDSPYQSFSTFAGNPYYIDLETLTEQKLLTKAECGRIDFGNMPGRIDYAKIYEYRFSLLRKAFSRSNLSADEAYAAFLEENRSWLPDYALFMALKKHFGENSWQKWPTDIKRREFIALREYRTILRDETEFWSYLQYLFFTQWRALKQYANNRGVKIIGDIPIYVALDSADAWANPGLFQFDGDLAPILVAGCPPDAFTIKGQLWGNPVYRWEEHEKQGYNWWISRIRAALDMYDTLRIDHFRGFSDYYAIPANHLTAERGKWYRGPDMKLFKAVNRSLGRQDIIAEDLGFITPRVKRLLNAAGYPGMKILQFAFSAKNESDYLPHNHRENAVVYTGTHDNDTTKAWISKLSKSDCQYMKAYLNIHPDEDETEALIRAALSSVCKLAIIPMQDYLGLGSEARINVPSSEAGNWQWRLVRNQFGSGLAGKIAKMTKLYGRARDLEN